METKSFPKEIKLGEDYPIWHYTSPEVFTKLLNNEIYATHFRFLNDDMEISYAIKVWRDYIQSVSPNQELNHYVNSMLKHDVYVMCFSTNGDSLPLWRAYTPKTGGFSIGFSRNQIITSLLNHSNSLIENNKESEEQIEWNLLKCKYYSEEQLKEHLSELYQQMNKKNNYSIGDFFNNLFDFSGIMAIIELILTYKHTTFATECEERILGYGTYFDGNDEVSKSLKLKGNTRNSIEFIGGKPRVKIPLASVKNCIKSVTVSPHGDKELNFYLAKLFRDKYKLENLEIKKSSSPYNGK